MTLVAVDLGGTRLKAARWSVGRPAPTDVTTMEHGGDWRGALTRVVDEAVGAERLAVCVPGVVDRNRVVALPGKLPGIEGADLGDLLGLPVFLTNDAIAYGIGEAVHGAGRSHRRVVCVTLGTGVGVAVIEDGAPLGGGPLGGGILGGQITLSSAGGGTDTSGRAGTFEALCRAESLHGSVPHARDLPHAYELLNEGDAAAQEGFAQFRASLIAGLTVLALAHAPSVIVVGGGAAQAGLLEGVEEAIAPHLWPGQKVAVRLAELEDAAALAGLGVLAGRQSA